MAREEKTKIEDQIERISTIFKTVSEKNIKYTVKDDIKNLFIVYDEFVKRASPEK